VVVERRKALFSTWYERYPRSSSFEPHRSGTFKDCEALLPEIARLGFDVFYLPPIHPIGRTHRKGKNNSPQAEPGDPGSPWAIGAEEGGHKSIDPGLGTLEDFESLMGKAAEFGIEIALDLAYQCSPDHPYVKEHPEWFRKRPDGTIQYAENPPKKYQDIYPIDFETDHWEALWEELKSVVLFWIDRGVRIFRVDNPHTKAFPFWEWMIGEVRRDFPDVIFLSEAFTRPKVMYRLAKVGFSQSYTYFTWRNSKREFMEYLTELTQSEVREFFRPNFWPNTPDILPEYLQYGGRPAFVIRLILAATLSSNYGIYGPPFELLVNEPLPGREEYLDSEKYEIRRWNWDQPGNLKEFIARINRMRRENPALQTTWNLRFFEIDNEQLLFFGKMGDPLSESLLVVVNLDPFHTQSGWLTVPLEELGIEPGQAYLGHDLLSEEKYIWYGEKNFIKLNPHTLPAHVFKLKTRLKRETDFDYFM
jgi:starch synthase (maltosyl-transferring)